MIVNKLLFMCRLLFVTFQDVSDPRKTIRKAVSNNYNVDHGRGGGAVLGECLPSTAVAWV